MIDPIEGGGLGLDPPTVAQMVGHDDRGSVYTKLAQRRALERARREMNAYQERQAAKEGHLRVVSNE